MKASNQGRLGWRIAVLTTFMLFCATGAVMAQGAMASEQAQIWKQARKQTLAYIEKMPDAGIGFKPTPEVRSFSGQMAHLAYWNFAMFAGLAGKANPYDGKEQSLIDGIKTKAELTKFVTESYDFAIAALTGLDDAKLAEKVSIFGGSYTRMTVMTFALDHQAHHRGQTVTYLRLKGVVPPEG